MDPLFHGRVYRELRLLRGCPFFFLWTEALGKILTFDKLRRNIVVAEWPHMCRRSGESSDHLLIHCDISRELLSSILNPFSVEWVMPRRVLDLLVSWGGPVGCGIVMGVWRLTPLCLMWWFWWEMNAQSFEDVETSVTELRKIVINTLYAWIYGHYGLLVSSFTDFLNFCSSYSSY